MSESERPLILFTTIKNTELGATSISVGDDGSVTFGGVLKKVTESMLTSFPHNLLGTWIPNRAAIRYDREQIEGRRVKIFESGVELDLEGVLALAR